MSQEMAEKWNSPQFASAKGLRQLLRYAKNARKPRFRKGSPQAKAWIATLRHMKKLKQQRQQV